jgi:lipopolysaccharide/colanic/teichoic acid biosynthesis glycosyltransferase
MLTGETRNQSQHGEALPTALHLIIDALMPAAVLLVMHRLFANMPWTDFHSGLAVAGGLSTMLTTFLSRSRYRASIDTLSQIIRLTLQLWGALSIVSLAVLLANQPGQQYSVFLAASWIFISPLPILFAHRSINRVFYARETPETRILFEKNFKFTDHEREVLASERIKILYPPNENDIISSIKSSRPYAVVLNNSEAHSADAIRELTHLGLSDTKIYGIAQFMEQCFRKSYIDYALTDLSHLEQISTYTRYQYLTKRFIDFTLSLMIGFFSIPVILYIYFRIKTESPGPVIFRQKRVGYQGKEFTLYKFRSMHPDAENGGARYAEKDDPRTFPFGAFMRKTRLDELPQLWNVIKGDLHIIGPRPERKIFTDELEATIPFYQERHIVRPGISGWAQVMYPYGSNFEDSKQKLMYDLYYINNWNLYLELEIILSTIYVILSQKGY